MKCTRCYLHEGIVSPCVPYDGPKSLRGGILFLGEAPGREEDAQGRPFVGPTGKLLRGLVHRMELGVPVGFTNTVKCFPGKHDVRNGIGPCFSNLVKEVEGLNPNRIVAFGATALKALTGTNFRMLDMVEGWCHKTLGKWTGTVHFAIHPSYCLHNPSMRPLWLETTKRVIQPGTAKFSTMRSPEYTTVRELTSIGKVEKVLTDLIQKGKNRGKPVVVGLDTEYLSGENRLMCLAISAANSKAYVLSEGLSNSESVVRAFLAAFKSKHIQWAAHNWKFDAWALTRAWDIPNETALKLFVDKPRFWIDTSSLRKIYNPEQDSNLAVSGWQVGMGGHKDEMAEALGRNKTEKAYGRVYDEDPGLMMRYCGYDAIACYRLVGFYRKAMKRENLWRVWQDTMGPLGPSLFLLEMSGVKIDLEAMEVLDRRLESRMSLKLSAIRAAKVVRRLVAEGAIDDEFNPRSTAHKKALLFDERGLGFKPLKKTAKGGASTDAETLKVMAGRKNTKVLQDLLDYSTTAHRRSTYVQGYRKCVKQDGKIHSSYRQDVARTGRLSSQDPNIQNIPNRGRDDDQWIRRMIVPDSPDLEIMEVDGSQIELRAAAELSGDKEMLRCFNEGIDIHRRTASAVLCVDPADVTKEQRSKAKPVGFGLIFDMSAEGLREYARQSYGVDLTQDESEAWRKAFFKTYRGYRIWMIREIAKAKRTGCAWVYWLGEPYRRRWLPGIGSKNRGEGAHALRQSLNTPIQGLASEWTLRGLTACRKALRKGELPGVHSLNMTIHDSIVAVVETKRRKKAFLAIAKLFVSQPTIRVKLAVEGKSGPSFGDMEVVGEYP